jgi:hypothetical protein
MTKIILDEYDEFELPILNPHEIIDRQYKVIFAGYHEIHLREISIDASLVGNPIDISIILPIGDPPELQYRGKL